MRANTDRSRRFAFDLVPDQYDAGRARFEAAVVDAVVRRTRLAAGDRLLEIGAGTGQLTIPLAERGLVVTALEPARQLAARPREHVEVEHLDAVTVVDEPFESFASIDRFAAVAAANSFHWIAPDASFAHAAELLTDDGWLALLWNFPVLADAALQAELNEQVFSEPLTDLRQDPDHHLTGVAEALADGRRELTDSGRFGEPWWETMHRRERWSVERYAAFLVSLASTVEHGELIRDRLDPIESVDIDDHVYVCSASRHAAEPHGAGTGVWSTSGQRVRCSSTRGAG